MPLARETRARAEARAFAVQVLVVLLVNELRLESAGFGLGPSSAALRHFMKTSHPLPQPRASAAIRRRIWSREHCASCGERMRCPSGPRACRSASSATLRYALGLCAFERGAQLGALGLGGASFSFFFSRGRLPLQVT